VHVLVRGGVTECRSSGRQNCAGPRGDAARLETSKSARSYWRSHGIRTTSTRRGYRDALDRARLMFGHRQFAHCLSCWITLRTGRQGYGMVTRYEREAPTHMGRFLHPFSSFAECGGGGCALPHSHHTPAAKLSALIWDGQFVQDVERS
jgi:hypothetical protein